MLNLSKELKVSFIENQSVTSRLPLNVGSNFIVITLNIVIGIIMAPYLINHLGLAFYGLIALVNTFPSYINIFANGLSGAFAKFITISIERNEVIKARQYFFTAIFSLLVITILFLPFNFLLIFNTPLWLSVPNGEGNNSRILVALIILSTYVTIIASPIMTLYQVFHKFYVQNLVLFACKILALLVFFICFAFFAPKLWFIGLYQFLFAFFSFIVLLLGIKHNSLFSLKIKYFRLKALKQMGFLGFWISIGEVASLFFLMFSQTLIYKILGAEMSGMFAPVLIISSLLMMGSGAINNVLMPIIYRDMVINDLAYLRKRLFFITKILIIIIGFPTILILIYTEFLVKVWLGVEFILIVPMIRMVITSLFLGGIVFLPFSAVFRGKNLVKIPALVNLLFGILHILIVYVSFVYFDGGLYSFGYSFIFTFGIRGIIFNMYYLDRIFNNGFFSSLKPFAIIIFKLFLILSVGIFILKFTALNIYINIASFSACYIFLLYFYGINKTERALLMSVLKNK